MTEQVNAPRFENGEWTAQEKTELLQSLEQIFTTIGKVDQSLFFMHIMQSAFEQVLISKELVTQEELQKITSEIAESVHAEHEKRLAEAQAEMEAKEKEKAQAAATAADSPEESKPE